MSDCNFGSGIRCDKCGRLISLKDMQTGVARSDLVTMRYAMDAPEYRDFCPACVRASASAADDPTLEVPTHPTTILAG